MKSDKCGHCGETPGSCDLGTLWSDGAPCGYRQETETEKMILDLRERVEKLEQLLQETVSE